MTRPGHGAQFLAPDCRHRPAQAITLLETILAQVPNPPDLGGQLAWRLLRDLSRRASRIKRGADQSGVAPYRLLTPLLGPQQNFYTGETYALTAEHLAELAALEVKPCIPNAIFCCCKRGMRYWIIVML